LQPLAVWRDSRAAASETLIATAASSLTGTADTTAQRAIMMEVKVKGCILFEDPADPSRSRMVAEE